MSERPGFMLYHSDMCDMELFTDEELGHIVRALYSVSMQKEPTDFKDRALRVKFSEMARKIKRDDEKYKLLCQRNRINRLSKADGQHSSTVDNGRQGSSTVVNDGQFSSLTKTVTKELNVTKKGELRESDPPTVEAVKEYSRIKGYTFSPDVFCAYYGARGWAGVTDWKSLADLWHERERTEQSKSKHYELERDNDAIYDEYERRIMDEMYGTEGKET